ncbi:threonine/serine dehydratase [Sediminibacterium sp.]|uniref:threonine ammonia-lyase n=1 Tax=Sediminibacterium sp. TaxID=1917865 RepID=UPI0027338C21|nr:pyridoxal-phosphate dependent enzyme [Sediminibacterium sp.]MDP3395018.1 pyridoxal-phosphate dependent enzyme [Sediminibacterium sp.]MDP3565645.1 pyridoxal-phosphate dependent enzyme [Sediminibacterium sp.]
MITQAAIEKAHEKIKPFIHHTPVLTNSSINEMVGAELFFKCENFQKIGAFKIRGGMNAALSLSPEQIAKGLATHSSGNHAQAIAFAAKTLGTKAFIVMPENSPAVKVNAVKGYGAEVIFCAPNQAAREEALNKIVAETGAEFIHPYDDDRVITGQATCVKELIATVPTLEIVLTPVGGGGLLSGTALGAHYFKPTLKVYAGEPEGAADAILSFKSGKVEKAPYVNTIADGLLTTLSERTLSIIREHVTDIFLVTEAEIKAALRLVYERMKIVVEPSCVVPLAAVIKHNELFKDKKIGIILTGGNVDLKKFADWFND